MLPRRVLISPLWAIEPVGVSQRPRRERVGAEALVHQGERGRQVGPREIREHRPELPRRQHPLVGQRIRRQADDVEEAARERIDLERVDSLLDPLADHVQLALRLRASRFGGQVGGQVVQSGQADEQVLKDRLCGTSARTDHAVVRRDVAPSNQALPFLLDDARDAILDPIAVGLVMRQEDQPCAVLPGRGQRRRRTGAQECVGHLNQDAGTVAGVLLTSAGAAMFQIDQDLQRVLDDLVRARSLDVHDKSHAAGIVLGAGVVQTLSGRWTEYSRIGHGRHIV